LPTIICADVLDWAAAYDGLPFHALLTDCPYEYGFMGKSWDAAGISFQSATWSALAKHLLPGAFGMTFAGARTWHRIACAIEDAGLIIHPSLFLYWARGSGFPKATRIDTQVDKAAGAERTDYISGGHIGMSVAAGNGSNANVHNARISPHVVGKGRFTEGTPQTALARTWAGHRYGLQCIKPAVEPIIVFQKPYEGRPVDCITATGAGALNIDGCRIGLVAVQTIGQRNGTGLYGASTPEGWKGEIHTGRWPANLLLCHAEGCQQETVANWECVEGCPVRLLGEQSGELAPAGGPKYTNHTSGMFGLGQPGHIYKDLGTASRFFFQADWSLDVAEQLAAAEPVRYVPKVARSERDAGLEGMPLSPSFDKNTSKIIRRYDPETGRITTSEYKPGQRHNPHPTVKPLRLTQYLATLLLPPPQYAPRRILVPFAGSGSEMIGAALAGWEEILGVELDADYCAIAEARLTHWLKQPRLL